MVRHGYVKNPVGAHHGTGDWLVQRVSAALMALYIAIGVPYVLLHAPHSYMDWKALLGGGFFRLATMLFLAALVWHAWVGMRDILLDYVQHYAMRLAVNGAVAIVLVFYLIWSASILWGR